MRKYYISYSYKEQTLSGVKYRIKYILMPYESNIVVTSDLIKVIDYIKDDIEKKGFLKFDQYDEIVILGWHEIYDDEEYQHG